MSFLSFTFRNDEIFVRSLNEFISHNNTYIRLYLKNLIDNKLKLNVLFYVYALYHNCLSEIV